MMCQRSQVSNSFANLGSCGQGTSDRPDSHDLSSNDEERVPGSSQKERSRVHARHVVELVRPPGRSQNLQRDSDIIPKRNVLPRNQPMRHPRIIITAPTSQTTGAEKAAIPTCCCTASVVGLRA